jgi:hypothetical protein
MAPAILAAIPTGGMSLAPQVASAAAVGGLTSEGGNMLQDAALGGALSLGTSLAARTVSRMKEARKVAAAGRAAQQAAQAADDALPGARQAAQNLLASEPEFPLTLAQRTMNPAARQLEQGMANNPYTMREIARIEQQQAQRVAQIATEAMDVAPAKVITPGVLNDAYKTIGARMERVGDAIGEADVAPLMKRFDELAETSLKDWRGADFAGRVNELKKIVADQGGTVPGKQLMAWRSAVVSDISALSRSGNQPGYRDTLWQAVDAMDEFIAKSVPDAGIGASYTATRQQWKTLQAVEDALSRDGAIQPRRMAQVLDRADPYGFTRGNVNAGNAGAQGKLYDAVRFLSSSIGTPIVGTGSQTATRQAFNEAIANPTMTGLAMQGVRGATGYGVGKA